MFCGYSKFKLHRANKNMTVLLRSVHRDDRKLLSGCPTFRCVVAGPICCSGRPWVRCWTPASRHPAAANPLSSRDPRRKPRAKASGRRRRSASAWRAPQTTSSGRRRSARRCTVWLKRWRAGWGRFVHMQGSGITLNTETLEKTADVFVVSKFVIYVFPKWGGGGRDGLDT